MHSNGFWKYYIPSVTNTSQEEEDVDDSGSVQSFVSGELEYEESVTSSLTESLFLTNSSNNNNNNSSFFLRKKDTICLGLAFLILLISGSGSTILLKVQTIPLYNYPNFINLFSSFCFIPFCFMYILPMIYYGRINREQRKLSNKRHFAIIGILDCTYNIIQNFAAVYLPGPLLILLPQAAIPISMILSKYLLKKRYRWLQYVGALVVILGVIVVLTHQQQYYTADDYICEAIDLEANCTVCQVELTQEGCLSHRFRYDPAEEDTVNGTSITTLMMENNFTTDIDDNGEKEGDFVCGWITSSSSSTASQERTVLWSILLILSCLPMTLSFIYKEKLLSSSSKRFDIIYLNGWVFIFQTISGIILAIPAGMVMTPHPVHPNYEFIQNLKDGWSCYYSGINSIVTGCHPDVCGSGALYFNFGLVLNFLFVLSTTCVIRWGSTSLLFLALTIMVPLGNILFWGSGTTFHLSDLIGLVLILIGLVLYRFHNTIKKSRKYDNNNGQRRQQVSQPLNQFQEGILNAIVNFRNYNDDNDINISPTTIHQPLLPERRMGDI